MLTIRSEHIREALDELKRNGYIFSFFKKNEFLYCSEREMHFRSYELNITERFRYENKSEPSRNSVIYTVESPEFGLKGLLVS